MVADRLAYASPLRRAHPGEKALLTALALGAAVASRSPWVALAVALTLAALTLGPGGAPIRAYLRLWRAPLGFLAAGAPALAVSLGPDGFALPPEGLAAAGLAGARAVGGVAALLFLALTTPLPDLLALLRRLRTPEPALDLLALGYRSVFTLLRLAEEMHTAQVSRLGTATPRLALGSAATLGANLFLRARWRAHQVHLALVSRGYEGELRFLEPRWPWSAPNLAVALGLGGGLLALAWTVPG